jgi:hypothetical protein
MSDEPISAAEGSPARLKARETVEIAAAPAAVWAVLGRFGDMSWHPAVFATDDPDGEAIGAVRVLTLGKAGGPTITEALHSRDEAGMRYSYRITEVDPAVLPVVNYAAEIAVLPAEGGSRVEWRGVFDAPAGVTDLASVEAITGVYRGGLDAAKRALEAG